MSILEKLKRRQDAKTESSYESYDTSSSCYPNDENFNSENSLRKPTHHRKSVIQREKKFSSSSSSDNQISLIQRSRMQEELFAQNCNEQKRNKKPADSPNSSSSIYSHSNGRRDYQHRFQEDCSTITAGVLHLKRPLVNPSNEFYYEDRGRMAPMDWNQINEEASPTKLVEKNSTHQPSKPQNESRSTSEIKSDDPGNQTGMFDFIKNTRTPDTVYRVRGNVDLFGKSNDFSMLKIQKMRDRNCCNNLQVDSEINEMFSVERKISNQPHENGTTDMIDDIDQCREEAALLQTRGHSSKTNGDIRPGHERIQDLRRNALEKSEDCDNSNIPNLSSSSNIQDSSSTRKVRSRVDETDDDAFKFVKQVAAPESSSPSTSSVSARSSSSSEKFKKFTRKVSATSKDSPSSPNIVKKEAVATSPSRHFFCKDVTQDQCERATSRVNEIDDDAFIYQKPNNMVSSKYNHSICSAMDSDDMSLDKSSLFENSSVFPVPKYEEITEKPQSTKIYGSEKDICVTKTPAVKKQEPDEEETGSQELSPEFFSKYFTKLKRKVTVDIANIVENNDDFIPTKSNELLKPVATRYFSDGKIHESHEQNPSHEMSPKPRRMNGIEEIDCNSHPDEKQQSDARVHTIFHNEKSQVRGIAHTAESQAEMTKISFSTTKRSVCTQRSICTEKNSAHVMETNFEELNRTPSSTELQSIHQKIRKIRSLTSSPMTDESRLTDSHTSDSQGSSNSQGKSKQQKISPHATNSDKLITDSQDSEVEYIAQKSYDTHSVAASSKIHAGEKIHSNKSDSLSSVGSSERIKQEENSEKMTWNNCVKLTSPSKNLDMHNIQQELCHTLNQSLSPLNQGSRTIDSDKSDQSDMSISRQGFIQVEEVSSSSLTKNAHPFDAKIDELPKPCDSTQIFPIAPDHYDEGIIRFGYSSSSDNGTVIQTLHVPSDSDLNETLECVSISQEKTTGVKNNFHNLDDISDQESDENSDVESIHCVTISSSSKEASSVIIQEIDDADEATSENEHIETIKSVSTPETIKYQADIDDIDSQEEFDVVGFEGSVYFERMAKLLGVTDLHSKVGPSNNSSQQLEIM